MNRKTRKAYISEIQDLFQGACNRAEEKALEPVEGEVPLLVEIHKATSDQRALGLWRGWREILIHHRCPREVIRSCQKQVLCYLRVESESDFFKRAKYIGTMYMGWYLRAEEPAVPPGGDFIHTGPWRGWARSRRFCNRKNTHLWYSLLQAKRCALPLSQDMVLATYEKHRKAMERVDPIDEETRISVLRGLLGILGPVRRALTNAYSTSEDLEQLSETSWTPSENAAFELSKAKGGQKQVLINIIAQGLGGRDPFKDTNPLAAAADRILPDLVSMQFYPKVLINGVVRTNYVVESYEFLREQSIWDDHLCDEILTYDTGQSLKCMVYGILEPLKVRVISKGEAVPYYASKELQKRLHSILRRWKCFRLIGRPLCPTDLIDCKENPAQTGLGVNKWFSIDYSSATDYLSASLSEDIIKYIIGDLPLRMQELFLRVLAPHLVHYPEIDEVTLPPVQQMNGQLMGSPLSFPILCLANLGLYLEVLKDDPRSFHEKLSGVLVNGDDMIYVAPDSLWDRHVEIGLRIGLEMTPGKAYKHRIFANANSTCFHYDLSNPRSQPWQIDFLNTGLLFGQNKVLMKDTTTEEGAVHHRAVVINELLKGSLPGKAKVLLKRYLGYHKDEIRKECAGRNLFISPSLGGMGAIPPLGWVWKVTQRQRMTATVKAQRLGRYAEFGAGPLRGVILPEPMDKVHPFMRLDFVERDSVHASKYSVKKYGTFLKSSLLRLPMRVSSFGVPGWRSNFYFSSKVEVGVHRDVLSSVQRRNKDLFIGLADEWESKTTMEHFCTLFDIDLGILGPRGTLVVEPCAMAPLRKQFSSSREGISFSASDVGFGYLTMDLLPRVRFQRD